MPQPDDTDFLPADTQNQWWATNRNDAAISNLFGNRNLFAVGLGALAALAAASAVQLAALTGTNYSGTGASCPAYSLSAIDDPEMSGSFAGQQIASGNDNESMSNLNTVYNSKGGETTTSANVVNVGSGSNEKQFINQASMQHDGPQGWTLSVSPQQASDANTAITATVTDAAGHAHSVPWTAPDGTVFAQTAAGNIQVTQALNGGGVTTTSFALTLGQYINVSQTATGAAVISGDVVNFAMNSDVPVLLLPCSQAVSAPSKAVVNGPGNVPTIESVPIDSNDAATESM